MLHYFKVQICSGCPTGCGLNGLFCRPSNAFHEKPLNEEKKLELLASLNSLSEENVKNESYEPSFISQMATNASAPCRKLEESVFGFDPVHNNPFNSTSFQAALDSSINSVKSTVSIDSQKKTKLMRELFSSTK